MSNKIESQSVQISHVPPIRCAITHCPSLSACLPTVKPTVVDVGIYVNSIGPVSSIDMVSSGLPTHVPTSPDVSMAALWRGWVVVVVVVGKRGETGGRASLCLPASARIKPMSFKSSGVMDLCYGSSPLSGQAASLCGGVGGRDTASAQV